MTIGQAIAVHKVVEFDFAMVKACDLILANMSYAVKKPTGTLAEISWAYALRKPVIVVGENEFTAEAFVCDQATIVVPDLTKAMEAIEFLIGKS